MYFFSFFTSLIKVLTYVCCDNEQWGNANNKKTKKEACDSEHGRIGRLDHANMHMTTNLFFPDGPCPFLSLPALLASSRSRYVGR